MGYERGGGNKISFVCTLPQRPFFLSFFVASGPRRLPDGRDQLPRVGEFVLFLALGHGIIAGLLVLPNSKIKNVP